MADETFALSPISARPAQPSEADYDAIQDAFMETSRGRWFLGEYAKRNRNADTRMVLDAVARIEETLAASKKPVRDPLLDQALESFRAALTQAREAAQAAVADLALEQNLAPVRKGARVIREIAWRLREIGADGRICDLIDSQVAAIEGAAARMAPADLASALRGAFDRIEERIAAFDASETTAPPAAEAMPPQAPASEPVAATPGGVETGKLAETGAAIATANVPHEAEAAIADPSTSGRSPPAAVAEAAPPAVATSEPHDAFDANDEALLDMVAMEMSAPDTDAAYEPKLEDAQIYEEQADEAEVQERKASASQMNGPSADATPASVASYEIDVTFPASSETIEAPRTASARPTATALQPAPARETISVSAPVPEPEPEPEPAPSLGSSLIANGIVPRPRAARTDPLAPIRRMTQTEKIAFFS